ncbi:MAG: DUF4097 family beta strand repeat-containing protein [Dehalococcoidia bacterium]
MAGTERFDLPVAVRLKLQSRSGEVLVFAEARDDVEVEGNDIDAVREDDGTFRVRCGRGHSKFTVRVPVGTDVTVGSMSGSVRMQGEFGSVLVTTMSGNIEVDTIDEGDLRSMSGSVTIGACRGRCRLGSVSGKVAAGELDSVMAQSTSGSIRIERVAGDVMARSVSGSVDVRAGGEGPIAVKTVSGKVRIALPEGTEPQARFKTMGRVRCDLRPGMDCRVDAVSLSGSIDVVPG